MNQVVPSSTLEHSSVPRKRPLNTRYSLSKWVRQSTSRAIRRHKPAAVALGCLSLNNPLRKLCLALVMWKWFERFIMVCVLSNTLLLGLVDYTNAVDGVPNPLNPRNVLIDRVNSISLYIFIGEAMIKIIALGFVRGKGTYLSDGWNRLDFIIIVSGAFSLIYSSGKLGVLRVLRILRPLRALHSVPGLKVLSGSLLSSLPALGNVAIILAFSYLVFAILGMELWRNSWHYRCRVTPFPVRLDPLAWNMSSLTLNTSYLAAVMQNPDQYRCLPLSNNDTWPNLMPCIWPTDPAEDSSTPWLCSASTSWGRQCGTNLTCGSNYDPYGNPRFTDLLAPGMTSPLSIMRLAEFNQNLNFGYTSFDNVYNTFVIIIQIVTASGWMILTETTQDAGGSIAAFIYFNAIFFIGACFLLQLNMAVLFSEFEKAKEQHSRMVDNQRRLSLQSSFTGSFKSLPSRSILPVPKLPQVVDLPKWTTLTTMQRRMKKIVKTKWFSRLSMLMTILNVVVLTTDHHPSTRFYQEVCDVLNSIFLLYFFVEMTLKMFGLSVATYWSDKFNRFDCFTVVTGIVEMILNPPFYIDGTISGASGFTALRAIRAIKLARAWKSLNKLLMSIMAAMGEILNFLFFLVLFIYIFALLGMEVFATKFQFDSNNYPMPYNSTSSSAQLHRSNFDTILWAFFTVFQVITYDNYPALIWDGWISAGWIAPLYFSGIVVLGVWVVMNMFSAILVESVMVESQESNDGSGTASTDSDEGDINSTTSTDGPPSHNQMIKQAQASQIRRLRLILRRVLQLHHHFPHSEFLSEDGHIAVFEGKSLCLFSLRHPLRHYCIEIVGHKAFTIFISLVIGFSCIMTAMDTPLLDPNSDVGRLINVCNYTFAVIFTSELMLNVIAKGFLFGPDAYMKDGWRILDAFIVVVSLIPLLVQTTSAVTGLRALRSLRALRPLRVINKLPQLKVVVNTLFRCLPDMGRAFLFVGFMLYIFGIMTTILFKGAIQSCSLSPYNYGTDGPPPWFPLNYSGSYSQDDLDALDIMTFPREYSNIDISMQAIVATAYSSCGLDLDDIPTSKQVCLCFNQSWSSQTPQEFDNIIWSVAGLYELTTLEGWTAVAFACIDSVGPDMQPIANSRLWVMVFWWIFIIVCSFFVTNLFIAVLCDAFMRENYGTLITEEQMQWIKLQRQVLAMRPHVVYPMPAQWWRRICYKIVHFTYFEHLITACILLNMLAMTSQAFGQSQSTLFVFTTLNYCFSAIFTIEAILKITAFGIAYFEEGWNRFDFLIVLFTALSLLLPLFTNVDLGATSTVVRVFRVGRALRLIKKARIIRNLFDTLTVSLPAVGNVTSLLLLLYYIYAAVGVQLFAKVGLDGVAINRHQNFQSFWLTFQMLIGFSTGENWDNFTWEVYKMAPATNPSCLDRAYNASMCGFSSSLDCIPIDGCGSYLIVPYMYSFFLVIGYVGLNVFSGIVIDALDGGMDSTINHNTLTEFAESWAHMDPTGTGLITMNQLADFLYVIHPPFGFKYVPGMTRRRIMLAIGELDIHIYDGQYVHFKDVPRALVQRILSGGDRSKLTEIQKLMQSMGINKQFDDMWFTRRGRAEVTRFKSFKAVPARTFIASLVIARLLHRNRIRQQWRRNHTRDFTKVPAFEPSFCTDCLVSVQTVMGWEGATGHLYLTGVNGCTRYREIEGRKVRAIYGNYTASLALVDGWNLEWMTPQPMELKSCLYDIKIYQLAFGRNHTIALSLDGHLFSWGDGQYGQLGLGGNINQAKSPQKIREIQQAHFTSIACGGYHSAAITDSGALYMWGRNFEGQIGHAMHCMTREQNEAKNGVVHHPKHVDDFLKKPCKQIACGDKFSIILTENGEVYACGEGQMGQLGQGRCTKQMHPMLTLLAEKHDLFVQVACGWAHALALTGSGRLFAWGFNHYGQLGVDDTKTRFFPEEIPGLLFKQVYASGNYSAGISSAGRLYTWGNGTSGKLGHPNHENVIRPKVVQAVQDTYIQSIACASDHLLFFAPSWVEQIIPTSGSFHGGTELKIFGSGFWKSPDLTVRFVPLTEGRLARATLATFDPSTGIISCEVPRFSVPGDFAVEVAMNGKHFTSNGVAFEVFVPPVFTFLSHKELPLVSSTQVHIHLRGTKPKATQSLLVRWVPLDSKYDPIIVGGEYGEIMKEITSENEGENMDVMEEDVENDDDMFMISFAAPVFDMIESELIACHVEVSFNGLDYQLVRVIEAGASDAEIVYFHEAAITRIVPNSISLVSNSMDIQIRLQQMFDIGQLKCRIRFSEEETLDLPYRIALANLQINSYSIEEQTVYCTIPPFTDWRVDTITPKSDDSDDDNSKRRPSVPQAATGPWYQPENQRFTMTVLVSLNGGATYLPPISPGADNIYAYTPGMLESIQPACGPLSGGTLATITSNYFYFDTNDAMVSIDFNGDIQFVPGFVKASEESPERRLVFEVPPFFVQPPAPTESPRPGVAPNYPAPPSLPMAVIKVALNGSTYHEESSLSFEFYFNPKIITVEPSVVSPGLMVQMTGELFRTSPIVKYRLAKADNSVLFEVQANYQEDKTSKVIKLEIPPLGTSADGELWFSIALNGQQYFTSENARIMYTDQPEPVATKDDKKKH